MHRREEVVTPDMAWQRHLKALSSNSSSLQAAAMWIVWQGGLEEVKFLIDICLEIEHVAPRCTISSHVESTRTLLRAHNLA